MKKAGILLSFTTLVIILLSWPYTTYGDKKKDEEPNKLCPKCDGLKRTIVVYSYRDDVHNNYSSSIRDGITDEFINFLQGSGCYIINAVNQDFEDILSEVKQAQSGSGADSGLLKEVKQNSPHVILQGTILRAAYWGGKSTTVNMPSGAVGGYGGTFGMSKNEVRITITVKIYDPSTLEVISTCEANGSVIARNFDVNAEIKGFLVGGKINRETFLGKAATQALEEMTCQMIEAINKIPWQAPIMQVVGNKVTIRGGSRCGMQTGQLLDVFQASEGAAPAPEDKKALQKVGQLRVVEVHEDISYCEVLSGKANRGMRVRCSQ